MSGPFFFAWCDADTAFNPSVHCVEDEQIYSFTVSQEENNHALLEFTILNPRVGLLAPSRKRWCWLSWRNPANTVIPLFYGQLVGIPDNIFQQVITIQCIAKPANYTERKKALADTLRVLPYYDPVFISEDSLDDPDAVLEGYSKHYHTDRVTHDVTVSDIITGEDGTLTFSAADVLADTVSMRLVKRPWLSYALTAKVSWYQQDTGLIPVNTGTFLTLMGAKLIQDWPKPGASLSGGWSVYSSAAVDLLGTANIGTTTITEDWRNRNKTHNNGDTMTANGSRTTPAGGEIFSETITKSEIQTGIIDPYSDPTVNIPMQLSIEYEYVMQWRVQTSLVMKYAAKRQRIETISFTVSGDFQRVLVDTSTDAEVADTIIGGDVGTEIDGSVPIIDLKRRAYFPTDRGLRSLEYLICVARARMLAQARGVEVEFSIPFASALAATLRKNARVNYTMFPGGYAEGKIIAYSFSLDGDTGEAVGTVRIGCILGRGTTADPPAEAVDDYADDYSDDYATTTGGGNAIGELWYEPPVDDFEDDGLVFPLNYHSAVKSFSRSDTLTEPDANGNVTGSGFSLELVNVISGPWTVAYTVEISDLCAACGVNLEAASWT